MAAIYLFTLALSHLPSLPDLSPSAQTAAPVVSVIKEERVDDFSSPGTGWDVIKNDSTGTADYSGDGTYQIAVNGEKFYAGMWEELGIIDAGDFALQVKALGPWGEQSVREQGIVIGWNSDVDIATYAFTLTSSGECKFRKRMPDVTGLNREKGIWLLEANEKISNLDTNKAAHELLLVKKDSTLTGHVDGQLCGQYTMADFDGGFVGVAMLGPGKSAFDDFAIFSVP